MDPKIIRDPKEILSDEEKAYIKQWVKDNFVPNTLVNAFWHPTVKSEWHKRQDRFDLAERMKKLDRETDYSPS